MSKDTRIIEKEGQEYFNKIYEELGYKNIRRIFGKENELYDLTLTINGIDKKIEEKCITYYHKDCPVELIQNIWPPSRGWFYGTRADYIHFLYCQDKKPYILYQLSFDKLKEELSKMNNAIFIKEKKAFPRLSIINYGITINLCIPWLYLIEKNYVAILKRWDNPIGQHELFHRKLKEAFSVPWERNNQ